MAGGSIRLAVEGCGHGTLHAIYASITESCRRKGWPGVDLLIIGGDFQAVRNAYDLNCVSMPAKYREMCDFHEYYSGRRKAPYLTIFVGGNHEASNYLTELYYGGWVAPNIYYMGAANVLRLGALRIAGMSGIWSGPDYRKPHVERLPYSYGDLRSVYHVRELDVRKLLQLRTQVDIGISHDWPRGVEWMGNWKQLFQWKKHLEDDARTGRLGSIAAKQVMDWTRPKHWFSAHLHVKYAAIVQHQAHDRPTEAVSAKSAGAEVLNNDDEIDLDIDDGGDEAPASTAAADKPPVANADEIDLELDDEIDGVAPVAPGQGLDGATAIVNTATNHSADALSAARAALPASFSRHPPKQDQPQHPAAIKNTTTHFLSLDKCLAKRDFLQLLSVDVEDDITESRPLKLSYDAEWLAITRAFALIEPPSFGDRNAQVPHAKSHAEYSAMIDQQRQWVDQNLADLTVPEDFEVVAPVYDGEDFRSQKYQQSSGELREYPQPHTARFCEMLQIPNPLEISEEEIRSRAEAGKHMQSEESEHGRGFHRGGGGRGRGRGGRGGPGGFRGRGRGR